MTKTCGHLVSPFCNGDVLYGGGELTSLIGFMYDFQVVLFLRVSELARLLPSVTGRSYNSNTEPETASLPEDANAKDKRLYPRSVSEYSTVNR